MVSHYTYTMWVYKQCVAYTVGYRTIDSWAGTLQYGRVQEIIIHASPIRGRVIQLKKIIIKVSKYVI